MSVKYVFIDGTDQDCFLPSDTPMSFLESIIGQYGITAVEVHNVPGY